MKISPINRMQKLRSYTLILFLLLLAACTQFNPQGDKEITEDIVEWPESTDTITIKPDSVRDMTHTDSIMFGLI